MIEKYKNFEYAYAKLNAKPIRTTLYFGPYNYGMGNHPFNLLDEMKKRSVFIRGPPGVGKTQYFRYFFAHAQLNYFYVKGTLSRLSHFDNQDVIIFDDVDVGEKFTPSSWNALTDVENGGDIPARYNDIHIDCAVMRLWICNDWPSFTGCNQGAIARRCKFLELKVNYDNEIEWVIVEPNYIII